MIHELGNLYNRMFQHGEVCELVAEGLIGLSDAWDGEAEGVVSGRFDNAEAFADAASALIDAGAASVRVTLSPIYALCAGKRNRPAAGPVSDHHELAVIRWLPVVVSGEYGPEAAERRADVIRAALGAEFRASIGLSGRLDGGAFVLVRLPDLEVKDHLSPALEAIGGRFDTESAKVLQRFYQPTSGLPVAALAAAEGPDSLDEIPVNPRGLLDRLREFAPKERLDAIVRNEDVSPFLIRKEGGRVSFLESEAAKWFGERFGQIRYTGGDFWIWNARPGVWEVLPENRIKQMLLHAIKDGFRAVFAKRLVETMKAAYFVPVDKMSARETPYLINLKNGVFDIHGGELLPHHPDRCGGVQLPVRFDPEARCPRWERFIDEIMGGDKDRIAILRQFSGYCLFGKILSPAVVFAIGDGRNGKSVFLATLSAMIGERNTAHVTLDKMDGLYGASYLRGKLLNVASEAEALKKIDSAKFKAITAGDSIQAERKNLEDITFTPVAKHCFAMNGFPKLSGATNALLRRIWVVEFSEKFEGDRDDTRLKETLLTEIDGIFMWALVGLREVLENGGQLSRPDSMAVGMTRLHEALSPVVLFLKEACVMSPGVETPPPALHRSYKAWAEDAGVQPLGRNRFYEAVMEAYPVIKRRKAGRDNTRDVFQGVALAA